MNDTSIPASQPEANQSITVCNMVDFLSRTSHAIALGGFNEVMTPFEAECLDLTIWSLTMALSTRPAEALPVAEKLWALLQSRDYAAVYEYSLNMDLWWGA